MITITKIGIIGAGFVGGAIATAYPDAIVLDIDPSRGAATYNDIKQCSSIFVCVPSPQLEDGRCDSSILESVLQNLEGYRGTIISKVTATPDIYKRLSDKYPNLVYVPEFLTAANAYRDFSRTEFLIVGGSTLAYMHEAVRAIEIVLMRSIEFIKLCSIEEAAFAKYAINSFLATKVVFMNELEKLSKSLNLDFSLIAQMMTLDKRIGNSHMQVPGPDGQYGFGGACFPKDTSAFVQYSTDMGSDLELLKLATKINTLQRLRDK